MKIKMVCMILGGGAGSRLFPLTETRSKPAVPIGGKYRLIDIPISNCLNSGVRRMFVLTQFNAASLNQHIKNTYNFDTFSHGFVDILAAEQTRNNEKWYMGTADAVRQCMRHLYNHDYDYILILSGDQLYQMDLEEFARFHINQNADVSIATIPVTAKEAPGFGIMKVDANGMINTFIEKPAPELLPDWESEVSADDRSKGKVYMASMGIYIFSKNIIKKLFAENQDATDFGKEIIPTSINGGYRVAGYPYKGYWEDIGTVESFFEANIAMAEDLPAFNLFDRERTVYTRPRMLAPSKIDGTTINRSMIAEASIIQGNGIEESVIGIRSRIGRGTVLKRCIVFGNDYFQSLEEIIYPDGEIPLGIGENCHLENCIVDKDARVGNDVVIKGGKGLEDMDSDYYVIRSGIVVLKKGAIIPNGSKIGLA